MDSYLKRKPKKNEDNLSPKKSKKEVCPHGVRCYRRNPHHFKEYDHPHFDLLIGKGDSVNIPDHFPQSKDVYIDQLKILNSLTHNTQSEKQGIQPSSSGTVLSNDSQLQSSSSNVVDRVRLSSKNKTTTFIMENKKNVSKPDDSKTMAQKIKENEPYCLFFSKIPDEPLTCNQQNSITFKDLLCPSLGELKCSLQINFMIDIAWLIEQYIAQGVGKKPLTIIYGDDWPDMEKYIQMMLPNVTSHFMKMKDPFGIHHSKIGIYVYTDHSVRVVVSTANLYFEDWNHYNQGLWVSPKCPVLPDSCKETDGVGVTAFKTNFLLYLKSYNLPILKDWIEYVKRADFSAVRTMFVYSAPGKSYMANTSSHLQRVGDLLSRHVTLPVKTTPESEGPLSWGIIAQASSIGSLGKTPGEWLRKFFLGSLSSHKQNSFTENSNATLNVIYPTVENVLKSFYGPSGGGCLPYSKNTNEKQKWLQDYLHQWKADETHRSRIMPHIKTYCRVSPCLSKLAWFLLTSANLSKSAWGGNIQRDKSVYVRSYEAGVLFLPKFFDEEFFNIKENSDNSNLFPIMYDLPLVPYQSSDYPWCN
ncbi:probable tyrosyl-DNA phosphodiesterase [Agrilus planipennis]|uniref:Probable tyrosyl-DNA phosphodiesterase n=1 Tax=Agrilus planipennis TaxID=224129 RepID=A0A1W4XJL3_AGRPL|nr:probable tyrosyl-DNA phosphodiesterase [Agrilus planipennis]